ncbi:MAG: biopolymer transporter ExbD [Planctomycetota bacterium]
MRIRSSDSDTSDVINMSSLLDVLFILIIFFLVTTTFKQLEDDHRVDLPVDQRNQALTNKAGDVVKINIRKSGAYVVMDSPVSEEQLESTMQKAVDDRPEVKVLIRADKETKHLYVANVLSICKYVGVKESHIIVKTLE